MIYARVLFAICGLFLFSCSMTSQTTAITSNQTTKINRGLNYTCRLADGGVIATTDGSVAVDPAIKKADLFIERDVYKPRDIADPGSPPKQAKAEDIKFLEEVVVEELTQKTSDWDLNQTGTIDLAVEANNSLPINERMIQIVRVKTQSKSIRYAKNIFSRVTGVKLADGALVRLNDGVIGQVTAIEGDEVKVDFKPDSDQPLDGPFGKIIVKDMGDYYQIEVDAKQGRLVRVGPAVGRISEVTDHNFTIDYSHPFGGEILSCDVGVTAIEREAASAQVATSDTTTPATPEATEPESDINVLSEIASPSGESKIVTESGDVVEVAYTASLESGEVVWTTSSAVANDPNQMKFEGYQAPETLGPETIVAGSEDAFPAVAETCLGMTVGARKKVVVSPDKAFGTRNGQLMRNFDRTKVFPAELTVAADEYVKKFGALPVAHKVVKYNPYLEGRVIGVTEQGAVLKLSPLEEESESDLGLARATVVGDEIHIHMTPRLGAGFELDNRHGKVVAVDSRQFTVDFNPPLAGEKMVLDVEVLSLRKAAEFADKTIQWIEDYEQGLATARKMDKPAVLVLYADWCSYCEKLLNTTMVDPRIKVMRDDFVWIKANSDKDSSLKMLYEQKGFPLTVLLDSHGEVITSISGYKPAGEFKYELEKVCDKIGAQNATVKAKTVEKSDI